MFLKERFEISFPLSQTFIRSNLDVANLYRPLRNVRPIYRTGVPLPSKCGILYTISTTISTEYFKHAAHSPFFPSKCRLLHNAIFFGSCIIHILHTGVLKFKCKICKSVHHRKIKINHVPDACRPDHEHSTTITMIRR
jgi:hypothetical protein